ncbi:nitrilase/cyanide hydratase and apolipoprotein N-acyltransferase [Candidatus Moduliflexus flocculans]|uniref:Nitrilase/cyanide hydratase and apolipoprotein N-acyltransferase n=1 Tax=Candidatus Moduliflexus flocculans TaxID=1499966 RepID=A0A081BQV8_9BACT|nr:nitrilase/cyanide hydratase and apolipoprotein N-acyltransferase [Candidatus Moduliflexus flocculans]
MYMPENLMLGLAQFTGRSTPESNLAAARDFALEASQKQVKLLAFPEMLMAVPQKDEPLRLIAEPLDGAYATALAEIAKEFHLYLLGTIWEKSDEHDRVFNTALLFSPEGKTVIIYRKLHLFDALNVQESRAMKPGQHLPEIASALGQAVGVVICYDLRFPELFRHLARQGAEVILVPAAWYAGTMKEDHWLTLLRARAIENTCYVVGINQVGAAFCGRSAVFDPYGVQLADGGERTALLCVPIDCDRLAEVRSKLPALRHIRNDLFG